MNYTQRLQRGFTITELIIVITVIGILATIGLISYSGYRVRAAKSSVESTAQQVKVKLGEYYTDNNGYPKTKADIVTYLNSINAQSTATAFNTTKNGVDMVYTPTTDTGTSCTTGTPPPACAKYTITIAPAYWGGASGDPAVSVTQ